MNRDLVGYGEHAPDLFWPNQAKVAVNFVINYEEGAERTPVNGDHTYETYGSELNLTQVKDIKRHLSMESLFEYGSRTGIWRLLRLFDLVNIPTTLFACGLALKHNPSLCEYLKDHAHEVAGHGWRWLDYAHINQEQEKKHIRKTIKTIRQLTGQQVCGWYTGRKSEHTRDIIKSIGGILYDSDNYADDLPYFDQDGHLIIPYTLVTNDFRFCTSPGFSDGKDFFHLLKDTLDYLLYEDKWAMMTIALHARISGHPGRCQAVKTFINYLLQQNNIWIATRLDIAQHFKQQVVYDKSLGKP